MSWRICAATAVLATAVGGCGAAPAGGEAGDAPAPEATPVWVEPACPDWLLDTPDDAVARGGIPADFVTSWVLRCGSDVRDVPGDGRWLVRIAERADTPASELVDQLRLASESPSNGPCSADLVIPPYFVLVDQTGRALLPAIPTDGCGKPRREAREALHALPFREISETPVRRVESQQAIDSGCSESWKDEIAINAGQAAPGPATALWPAPVETLRVCVYDIDRNADGPVGQFASGRTLTGDVATALADALDEAGPATACSTPHSRFAVITAEHTGRWAVAEFDGCRRLQRPDNTLGQLDGNAIAMLLG